MLYLPSARRFILPSLVCLIILTLVHLIIQQLAPSRQSLVRAAQRTQIFGTYIPSQQDHVFFDQNNPAYLSSHPPFQRTEEQDASTTFPPIHPRLVNLLQCPAGALNPTTFHLRLPNPILNISMIPPSTPSHDPTLRFFNPAIIPLPHWSGKTTYVLVTRLVTAGHHQESHICLADICSPPSRKGQSQRLPADVRICTDDDLAILGSQGGMRCTTPPRKINIPSTPAHSCSGAWLAFPDIPGFHDPRVFWSGKGEPLILINSASQYGCVGLWIIDLRPLFPELEDLLKREGRSVLDSSRAISYGSLTEITRNPSGSRSPVEKNWLLWFPNREDAYVQFDLLGGGNSPLSRDTSGGSSDKNTTRTVNDERRNGPKGPKRQTHGGRTFAKLIGNGYTTPNLTSPHEQSCFDTDFEHHPPGTHKPSIHPISSSSSSKANHTHDSLGQKGHWHQGSNSLRLILCTRAEARQGECDEDDDDNNNNNNEANNRDHNTHNSTTSKSITPSLSVHFAIINRKFSNLMDLPLRYERYIMVWEGKAPFRILGVSRWPLVWRDEWVRPWSFDENFEDVDGRGRHGFERNGSMRGRRDEEEEEEGGNSEKQDTLRDSDSDLDSEYAYASFTYTPSLAWSWMPHSSGTAFEKGRRHQDQDRDQDQDQDHDHDHDQDQESYNTHHTNQFHPEDDALYLSRLGTGYLGDDVLVGVGLDDVKQGFVRIKVDDLISCLRLCPGIKKKWG
ncbi:hypothetical protein B0A52_07321 [Exophiala mesophila]|uniref:Uncharacterized protein n=1 Tax=Exophiala mesophila TaxID=212818 RepID=A0A438MX40_EXOME|nr:hypothetical protein B0A52_07321 [Exophiala mesophila]